MFDKVELSFYDAYLTCRLLSLPSRFRCVPYMPVQLYDVCVCEERPRTCITARRVFDVWHCSTVIAKSVFNVVFRITVAKLLFHAIPAPLQLYEVCAAD